MISLVHSNDHQISHDVHPLLVPSLETPGEVKKLPEKTELIQLCIKNQWEKVFDELVANPKIALMELPQKNNISTTILHKAITSNGDVKHRAKVMFSILNATPEAAAIRNGYGSYPLHVITQRNTKLLAKIKEKLIRKLVSCYKQALVEPGGNGRRTPIHILFTDYISADTARYMLELGPQACKMPDKNGYLPAHIACSRFCSPRKLKMLLDIFPQALFSKTTDGETCLSLAVSNATTTHPNYRLIQAIKEHMREKANLQPADWSVPLCQEFHLVSSGLEKMPHGHKRSLPAFEKQDDCSRQKMKRKTKTDYSQSSGVEQHENLPTTPVHPEALLLHFSRNCASSDATRLEVAAV